MEEDTINRDYILYIVLGKIYSKNNKIILSKSR